MAKKEKKFSWFKFWIVVIPSFFAVNWCYHAFRKPAEVIGLFGTGLYRNPRATWEAHKDDFINKSTSIMTPEFLAALAQVETNGNPIARTYWRWKLSTNLFEIYAPASSAAGLFQITDGTFEQTKKYCVSDGVVRESRACWFNSLYTRFWPSHAIEMTSAYLHTQVERVLARTQVSQRATVVQKQKLATIIHLCGPGRGEAFVRRGFKFATGERCGSHPAAGYVDRVLALKAEFARLHSREVRSTF